MKKIRLIMCLTMALTILMGSVLSVSASETSGEKTVFENNLNKYFVETNGFYYEEHQTVNGREVVAYKKYEFADKVHIGGFTWHDANMFPFKNMYIISENEFDYRNIDFSTYSELFDDALIEQNELLTNKEYNTISTSIELDGKTYYCYIVGLNAFIEPQNSTLKKCSIPIYDLGLQADFGDYSLLDMLESDVILEKDSEIEVDKPPFPEEDETFAFVDFQINEYVSATWSGTTFDDRVNEFDNMGFEVTAVYAFDNSLQIATNEVILDDGNLLACSWSKKQLLLQHEDESLYLRAVVFTPYCEKYGQRCVGKSETIWLTSDGDIDYIPNGELTMIEDNGFYLKGVSVEESFLGLVDGDVRSYISWTGTTRDNMIAKVPLDKTYADILCLCYTPTYKTTFVDLYELDTNFMGGKPLSLRRSLNDVTQSFYIDYSVIDEHASAMGLIFSGKLYITPYFYYENDNAIYKGAVTIVNILHNELEQNPDDGGILVPDMTVTPSPSPGVNPDLGGDGDIDNIDIGNIFNTVWNFLKSLWDGMGQFPSLMYSIFPYIPQEVYTYIGLALLFVIIFRFIGR